MFENEALHMVLRQVDREEICCQFIILGESGHRPSGRFGNDVRVGWEQGLRDAEDATGLLVAEFQFERYGKVLGEPER